MNWKYYITLFCFFLQIGFGSLHAQVTAVDSQAAAVLVEKLIGRGVTILNPVLSCPAVSSGIFSVTGSSNLGLDNGIILTSGRVEANGPFIGVAGPSFGSSGPDFESKGDTIDHDLSSLVPAFPLKDVCKLEFDFIPSGQSVAFDYVFASTEYRAYSCSRFNDVFGFFISGPGFPTPTNIATIPGTSIPVSVNSTTDTSVNFPTSINYCTNMGTGSPFAQYYVDNLSGNTISYGGFTRVLTASAALTPCQRYHLKLVIADCSDAYLDSGVFLKAGSFTSDTTISGVVTDTAICDNISPQSVKLKVRSGYPSWTWNNGSTDSSIQAMAPGKYWVKYASCYTVVDTFHVSTISGPQAFDLGKDTAFCEGAIYLLLKAPEGTYRYLWQDASTGSSYQVKTPGRYFVTILDTACKTSDTINVSSRHCDCFAIIPNAFTPNNDGINDFFQPRLSKDCLPARGYMFRIYNRWGQNVYSSYSATDQGWDGTFHGKAQQADTYFYQLKGTGRQGVEISQEGDVTLVR